MRQVETKFVRLRQAVELGDDIDGWRVCWLGGWDKGRVFYVAMVLRVFRKTSSRDNTELAVSVSPACRCRLTRAGGGTTIPAAPYPLRHPMRTRTARASHNLVGPVSPAQLVEHAMLVDECPAAVRRALAASHLVASPPN